MRPAHVLILLFVIVVWGFNFVVAKWGLQAMPPLLLMGLRFALVAALLVWFVRPPWKRLGQIVALSVTLGSLHFSLMFLGLTRVDASVASIAVQLQVPFAALLSAFIFKDYLGWRRTAGLVVAFAGIILVAGEPRVSADLVHLLLIVAASFVWAVGNIQVKTLGGIDGMTLNAWISLCAAPQLLLLSAFVEEGQLAALANAGWRGYGAIAYMAIPTTIVGYGIWYNMIARYPTNQTMPFTLLLPVVGVLAGVLALGEPLTWQVVLGGLVTVLGVGVIVLRRPKLAGPEV